MIGGFVTKTSVDCLFGYKIGDFQEAAFCKNLKDFYNISLICVLLPYKAYLYNTMIEICTSLSKVQCLCVL